MSDVREWVVRLTQARPRPMTSGWTGVDRAAAAADDPIFHPPAPIILEDVRGRSRLLLDGMGTINRALERDLLSFRTGDVTMLIRDEDGGFGDLIDLMEPTDRYQLDIDHAGQLVFSGVILGRGSIIRQPDERVYEVTAYGLTKLLDEADGGLVRRTLPAGGWTLNGNHAATATTLLLNSSAADMRTGDTLHITDHLKSEDVVVKQLLAGSLSVSLEAGLLNAYAGGTVVTMPNAAHRFKSIDYLVRALAGAAYIPVAEVLLDQSQFSRLAPTPVNLEGLPLTASARRGMAETVPTVGGLNRWNIAIHGIDGYTQIDPDDAWFVQSPNPDHGPYDWSPYFKQGAGDPGFLCFEPSPGSTQETGFGARFATYWGAIDYMPPAGGAPRRIWCVDIGISPQQLQERTTVGGVIYTAPTAVALPDSTQAAAATLGLEYDPVRDIVYVARRDTAVGSTQRLHYRDLGGAAWVNIKPAGDAATTGYFGPRYIADLDYTLMLKNVGGSHTGPTFTICAFRGAALLWERPFPPCLIAQDVAGNPCFYPTRTARFVNGSIYITLVSDGAVQLVRSDDEFRTYTMRMLVPSTSNTQIMACRIGNTYRIFCYRGAAPRGYFICAPLYAGVIERADFTGQSTGEGFVSLAVIADAAFWVDDHAQLHFVARSLIPSLPTVDITDLVIERSSVAQWDQAADYVQVTGDGGSATAGDPAFASEGVTINSPFVTNDALAQALADSYLASLAGKRPFEEVKIRNPDLIVFQPMQRVILDGGLYLVYEVDDARHDREAVLRLLTNVEE